MRAKSLAVGGIGDGGTHHGAVAQHRDPIRQGQHLVKLVGYEHQAATVTGHSSQRHEQVFHLAGGEHSGWLVQHQQAGLAQQGLDDLHSLAFTNPELPQVGIGVDFETVRLGQFDDPVAHPCQVGAPESCRTQPQRHVLGDGEGGNQHEVLVDHAYSRGDRACG